MPQKKPLPEQWQLYVILDRKSSGRDLVSIAREAIGGGCDAIQLRDKGLSTRELITIGKALKTLTAQTRVTFIVNDRVDIAYAVDADGVHLGQDDLPIPYARSILGPHKLMGISTHSLKQALEAEQAGADYIGVGPIFATPTKPDDPPVGLELIRQVKRRIHIPFVAIGGIDQSNVRAVVQAGAKAVAAVRAIAGSRDVMKAAQMLKQTIEEMVARPA